MLASDEDKGKSKEEVEKWTGYPGGAPCNVACGLGLLKIPVAFVSCLGKDDMGDELMQLMRGKHSRSLIVNRSGHRVLFPRGFHCMTGICTVQLLSN
jgi:sugar/nucleoside kinase (ribokinase family)